MEQASIEYKGMTNQPSDYLCEDGDMLEAVYAEWRDGSYHAARIPKGMTFHVEGFRPRFLHEPSDGKKYYIGIKRNEEDAKWVLAAFTDDGSEVTVENAPSSESDEAFGNFCALGNVVCLTFVGNITKILFSANHYECVNIEHAPLNLLFGSKLIHGTETGDILFVKSIEGLTTTIKPAMIPDEYANNLYYCPTQFDEHNQQADDFIFSALNKTIALFKSKCQFVFPVLLKYAIKLYSGEYINVSPPVLLFPYTGIVSIHYDSSAMRDYIHFVPWEIYFSIPDTGLEQIRKLKDYGKIVESIDFFITPQIYDIRTDHAVMVSKESASTSQSSIRFIKTKSFEELYKNTSYYLVKSIKINDLDIQKDYSNGLKYYPLLSVNGEDEAKITAIEQQEVLKYGSYSNSEMSADSLTTFNSRLFASAISKDAPSLWPMDTLCPICLEDVVSGSYAAEYPLSVYSGYYTIFTRDNTYVRMDNKSFYGVNIKGNSQSLSVESGHMQMQYVPRYFEYPVFGNGYFLCSNGEKKAITLRGSDFNNSTFFFFDSLKTMRDNGFEDTELSPSDSGCISYSNLVKASDVNDPFTFKDGNSCECGRGSVIAIATSATPTSQGQFGQYPLFAFCTDGVYAIGIGTDGTIQNCSPFSTDIISGPEALVNVGRDIVFATKSGVFSIGESGRTVLMQVDNVNRHTFPDEIGNVHFNEWFDSTLVNHSIIHPSWKPLNVFMASNVKMAYDYQYNRIILYNPGANYCYLMDAASKRWSVLPKTFSCNLNPVAKCLMVEANKEIVTDYSTDIVLPSHSAYWVTRPFKLGDLNAFKTIRSIIQRGVFKDASKVQQALFGSNDLQHWVPVKSSKSPKLRNLMGSGYKYFRLAVFFKDMEQGENIAGASIGFDVRMNNKIR